MDRLWRGHERMHRLDRRFRRAPVADPVEVCGHVHSVGDFRCHDAILRPQYGLRSTRWNTEEVAAHLTEELREDLLARWSETHRKHHTVTHLHEMLDAIGLLADAGIEFDAGCTGRYPPPPNRIQTPALAIPAVDPFEHGSVREGLELDDFAAAKGGYVGFRRGFSASGYLAEDDHNILVGEETAGRCCEGLLR